MTVIHRKMCNELLFTEKYNGKSFVALFEECGPSITTILPGKKCVYNVAMFPVDCTGGKKSNIHTSHFNLLI